MAAPGSRPTVVAAWRPTAVAIAFMPVLMVLLVLAAPVTAAEVRPTEGVLIPAVLIGPDTLRVADQSTRVDRSARVLSATAYQTMAVAGLVGGAIVVGTLAGGLRPALLAGAAVFTAYTFMP
jgi:hypothetical protein